MLFVYMAYKRLSVLLKRVAHRALYLRGAVLDAGELFHESFAIGEVLSVDMASIEVSIGKSFVTLGSSVGIWILWFTRCILRSCPRCRRFG